MNAPNNMAEAIRANRLIDDAWTTWDKAEPTGTASQDEHDAWQAGYEAFEEASYKARLAIRELPCPTLTAVCAKLSWLLTNDADNTSLAAYELVSRDLTAILDRPTQDAFAVKLRAHQRAVQDRDSFDAAHKPADGEGLNEDWRAYESIMSPLHSAVFDTGKAVMLEPAPDLAALIEKRAIFDALQYDEDADAPAVTHRLFADAFALAGGAA